MLRLGGDQAFLWRLRALDVAGAAVCWALAYWLRFHSGWCGAVPPAETPPWWWCARELPLVAVLGCVSFHWAKLYQLGRRLSWLEDLGHALRGVAGLLLMWLALRFYLRDPYESRLATLIFAGSLAVWLIAGRRLCGWLFHRQKRGGGGAKALIVGSGHAARRLDRALRRNAWFGIEAVGYVDDAAPTPGVAPLGPIADLPALLESAGASYVFIALPLDRAGETKRVLGLLANVLVDIRIVPDLPRFLPVTMEARAVEGLPVLALQPVAHSFAGVVGKRAMDIAASALGLLCLAPLLLLLAALVKLTSKGPALYTQERMGLNGRRFGMLKFRSMRLDAEAAAGPQWATAGDDRRTRFGSFLRRTSLDELPQLWNVLKGDMSLVGPRPERPYFIERFRGAVPRYMLRHTMKAGITGWAQVNGWRGNTSLRKRVQYDLYYIANWSPWMDLKIIYLTFARALWDKNAY